MFRSRCYLVWVDRCEFVSSIANVIFYPNITFINILGVHCKSPSKYKHTIRRHTHTQNCQHDQGSQAAELGTILSASPKSPIYRIFFLSSVGKRDNNDPYDLIYWCINYNWISNARFLFFKYGHQKLSTAKLSTLRVHLVKNQKSNRIERNRPPLNEPTTITTNHKLKKNKHQNVVRNGSLYDVLLLLLLLSFFYFIHVLNLHIQISWMTALYLKHKTKYCSFLAKRGATLSLSYPILHFLLSLFSYVRPEVNLGHRQILWPQ